MGNLRCRIRAQDLGWEFRIWDLGFEIGDLGGRIWDLGFGNLGIWDGN